MADISFEEQIRLEEEEKKRKETETEADDMREADEFGRIFSEDGLSYADKDGAVYEWEPNKKAWFPKIDEDFIARYQMSYGTVETSKEEDKKEEKEGNAEAYRQWYSQYQQWYNSQRKDKETDKESDKDSEKDSEREKDDLPPMPEDPNSEEYRVWYQKWMDVNFPKKKKKEKEQREKKEGDEEKEEEEEEEEDDDDDESDESAYTYEDYMKYWNYYYGPDAADAKGAAPEKPEVGKKRKMPSVKEPPSWFDIEDAKKNTNVYVSNLPLDITMDEFKEFMSKVGIIMTDETTRQPKIKLYVDESGNNKGDGRCCYLKYESVQLAEQILDGYLLNGKTVKVEQATFQMKGEFNPALRKKKRNNRKAKKNQQEKLLEWRLEKGRGQRAKREKTTILKNVFDASDFEVDPTKINVLRDAVKADCAQFGDVKKVVVHDRNPEGAISVIFAEAEHSDACIAALHGRLRQGRKISAECWDGRTKYDVQETEEEREARLDKWRKYLVEGEGEDAKSVTDVADVKNDSDRVSAGDGKNLAKDDDEEADEREEERQNDFLENDDED